MSWFDLMFNSLFLLYFSITIYPPSTLFYLHLLPSPWTSTLYSPDPWVLFLSCLTPPDTNPSSPGQSVCSRYLWVCLCLACYQFVLKTVLSWNIFSCNTVCSENYPEWIKEYLKLFNQSHNNRCLDFFQSFIITPQNPEMKIIIVSLFKSAKCLAYVCNLNRCLWVCTIAK